MEREVRMSQQIVIGVDGSETSLDALGAAAALAELAGSRLSVVFVRDPGVAGAVSAAVEGQGEAVVLQTEDELAAAARERTFDALSEKHVEWTFDVATGDAAHELLSLAKRRHAALIVVGGRRHTTIGGVVLGSVAQKLLHISPISVFVVRQPAPDRAAEVA
jgi:nucleotide-binding universal stress UspA family protein